MARRLVTAAGEQAAEKAFPMQVAKQPQTLLFFNTAGFHHSEQFAYNGYAGSRAVRSAGMAGTVNDLLTISVVTMIAILVAIATMVLLKGCRHARGTTLVAPLIWSLLSLWAVVAAATFRVAQPEPLRMVAATSTFCPLLALLGAKRPQNRAWPLIVVSFWAVAALPAIECWLLHPTEPLTVDSLWRWLFVVLIIMGLLNYWPTALGFSALLICISQTIILWPFLPLVAKYRNLEASVGIPLLAASIAMVGFAIRLRDSRIKTAASGWNRVWLDFRDYYGLLWGTRMAERIESLAEAAKSPVWLDWNGFHSAEESQTEAVDTPISPVPLPLAADQSLEAIAPGLRSLLRRFVSDDWMNRRLEQAVAPGSGAS